MNRPSYKELWLYERKDREEQLRWIKDAVNGSAKFYREPPYSYEEELAREIMQLHTRIAELEAAQRWIPVSEPPKECEMRVFKDGDAWCFVLPDFQDLQVSPSVWMQKGVLDKIYKELRSVRDE